METYKEGNQHLNEMFKEARQEKPLVGLDEVKNILPLGAPATAPHSKLFHFGISHIIVISGIVISSGLAYVTMKTDKTVPSTQTKTEQTVQQTAPAIAENPQQTIQSSPIKPQSSEKNNTLLASTDKKLISLPEDKRKKVALNEEYMPSQKMTLPVKFTHDEKKYEIIITGSDLNNIAVTSVKVDGVDVASEDYSLYTDAIDIAKLNAQARIKEEGDKRYTMDLFDKSLRVDKLPADENHYIFQLTSTQLLIDGVPQDKNAFDYYTTLYKKLTGKEVANGDEYQFTMKRKQLETKTLLGDVKIKSN